MDPDCIFCVLIRDDAANWVAVEEHALAFEPLPEDTLAPGATLVIPRQHRWDDDASFWPQDVSAHIVEGDPYAAIRSALYREPSETTPAASLRRDPM